MSMTLFGSSSSMIGFLSRAAQHGKTGSSCRFTTMVLMDKEPRVNQDLNEQDPHLLRFVRKSSFVEVVHVVAALHNP